MNDLSRYQQLTHVDLCWARLWWTQAKDEQAVLLRTRMSGPGYRRGNEFCLLGRKHTPEEMKIIAETLKAHNHTAVLVSFCFGAVAALFATSQLLASMYTQELDIKWITTVPYLWALCFLIFAMIAIWTDAGRNRVRARVAIALTHYAAELDGERPRERKPRRGGGRRIRENWGRTGMQPHRADGGLVTPEEK